MSRVGYRSGRGARAGVRGGGRMVGASVVKRVWEVSDVLRSLSESEVITVVNSLQWYRGKFNSFARGDLSFVFHKRWEADASAVLREAKKVLAQRPPVVEVLAPEASPEVSPKVSPFEAMVAGSLIRRNLLTVPGYSPYCGNDRCSLGCPRTVFDGSQFRCRCGWRSQFPEEFIAYYKDHWNL